MMAHLVGIDSGWLVGWADLAGLPVTPGELKPGMHFAPLISWSTHRRPAPKKPLETWALLKPRHEAGFRAVRRAMAGELA